MRHGGMGRRMRHRGGSNSSNNAARRPNQNQKNRVFDSNGPDVRIRGTAYQITEKYMALAKDAATTGDRVLAESYLQYAEHYQRLINSWAEAEMAYYDTEPAEADGEETEDTAEPDNFVFTRHVPVAAPEAAPATMEEA